jgi:hypothetical protein
LSEEVGWAYLILVDVMEALELESADFRRASESFGGTQVLMRSRFDAVVGEAVRPVMRKV